MVYVVDRNWCSSCDYLRLLTMYQRNRNDYGTGTQKEKMARIHRIDAIGYAYIYRR